MNTIIDDLFNYISHGDIASAISRDSVVDLEAALQRELYDKQHPPPGPPLRRSHAAHAYFVLVDEAIKRDAVEVLKYLIRQGANVNQGSPLVNALINKKPEMAALLVAAGATLERSAGYWNYDGRDINDILKAVTKNASTRQMPAYLAWRREMAPFPNSKKGGRRATRRSRRGSKKYSRKH